MELDRNAAISAACGLLLILVSLLLHFGCDAECEPDPRQACLDWIACGVQCQAQDPDLGCDCPAPELAPDGANIIEDLAAGHFTNADACLWEAERL